MVAFTKLLTSTLALAAPIVAQLTPAQVVTNIQLLTQKSQALQAPAQSITLINGPLILIGQGPFPRIITGFTDIVSTATTAITQMHNMPPVPAGAQSTAVFEAFREVGVRFACGLGCLADFVSVVCPSPSGSPEHSDWEGWSVLYGAFHWAAHRGCFEAG